MDPPAFLRIAVIVEIGLFALIGLTYRFRSFTSEPIDRRQEGPVILLGLRLTALAMLVAAILWMVDPQLLAWSTVPLPAIVRWSGVALIAMGGLFFVWTLHNLGRNLTDTVVIRREHRLVTTGPYRWVRHPFYLSFALCAIGFALATANPLFLVNGSIVFGFLVARTRIEEDRLIQRFGDDYRDYMSRVGRFWPRMK